MIVEIITKERDDLLPQLKPKQGGPKALCFNLHRECLSKFQARVKNNFITTPKDTSKQLNPHETESNTSLKQPTLQAVWTCSNFSMPKEVISGEVLVD